MDRIGEKLHKLRTNQGLTVRELAAKVEVSYSYIAQIETGRRSPSAHLILKLANFFQVTTDQLMQDELEID